MPYYLDWGVDPGNNWVENQAFGGPYINIKNMFTQAMKRVQGLRYYGAHYYVGNSAVNYNIIRYADVLLWAAEAEIEAGSIDRQGQTYVNMIRARAMNGCTVPIDNSSGAPSAH